jgi:Ala-tRNA(Pro) deacylase
MDDDLKKYLQKNKIKYTLHKHPAVFTVLEAIIHCGSIPGTHCKNLFLKNKKTNQFYLITIPYDKRLNLNQFRKSIGASKIRFGDEEDLLMVLGVSPGAVSPIGLVNDKENKTIFIIDEDIWQAEEVCCHPNINTETLQISGSDFRKLMNSIGNKIEIRNLPYLESSDEE